jgi:hypothetical protein
MSETSRKVKDLPEGTSLLGLNVKIPEYLRSPINLLNKGKIVGSWDLSDDPVGYLIYNRIIGIWLSFTRSDNGKTVTYPCFLKSLDEVKEFLLIE